MGGGIDGGKMGQGKNKLRWHFIQMTDMFKLHGRPCMALGHGPESL